MKDKLPHIWKKVFEGGPRNVLIWRCKTCGYELLTESGEKLGKFWGPNCYDQVVKSVLES